MSFRHGQGLLRYGHDDESDKRASVPVADQDAAVRIYAEVLGCDLRVDGEVCPSARTIETLTAELECRLGAAAVTAHSEATRRSADCYQPDG